MKKAVEYSNPSIARAGRRWLEARATGGIGDLRKVIPELAESFNKIPYYPDHFVDPYVGRIYLDDFYGEVLSMGFQMLSNDNLIRELLLTDPEHLQFMLGVLNSIR